MSRVVRGVTPLLVGVCVTLMLSSTVIPQTRSARATTAVSAAFGKVPLYFVEDRVRGGRDVAFHLKAADRSFCFTSSGVTVVLDNRSRRWVARLDFEGILPNVQPVGEDHQPAVFSYFLGPEKNWKKGLRTYARVVYRNLWPGIDLVYRATANRLKYEFHIRPGADPDCIRLAYHGVTRLAVESGGGLRVTTPAGDLEDEPPVAWQEIAGKRAPVGAAFAVECDDASDAWRYGFRVGPYDHERPLVIDPAVLVYCGYIGGSSADGATDIAVDPSGNVYVVGGTHSSPLTFPVKVGPDLTYAGDSDVFVAKVNPAGTDLVYCGYIGGPYNEAAHGIAVDSGGNAYITGEGGSGYPLKGGLLSTANGGAIVTKINATGTDLVYSGIIGGNRPSGGSGIAVDAAGNAYVGGTTECDQYHFPVKVGPDLTFNYGTYDCFVAKVNPQGSALVYCGYIGGSNSDSGSAIAIDPLGRAYLTGSTRSDQSSFPVKVGPDLSFNSAQVVYADAFVARVNAAGTGLDYCGYIGGANLEWGDGVAADRHGNAYVTGPVLSSEASFPVTVGPDLSYNGGGGDVFVAKVDTTGKRLVYCGYIGGSAQEKGEAIAVDETGAAYVTGYTGSYPGTFPVKHGPGLTPGGLDDVFMAKVNPAGTDLVYCGYIAGGNRDVGLGIALDSSGNAYVAGWTESSEATFPVKVGPDITFNDPGPLPTSDAFVAKIALTLLEATGTPSPGSRIDFTVTATGDVGLPCQMASSLSTGPIAVDTRQIDLGYDGLLWTSVSGLVPGVFTNYRGYILPNGTSPASLSIPAIPATVGLKIHTAFVTLDPQAPSGIRSISNTFSFTITK